MTVLQRFPTEEHGTIELGWNGTSIEVCYADEDGLVRLMVHPADLVDILEDAEVARETHP